MSAPINDGGPAFPTESAAQTGNTTWRYEGMTLRDHFAGEALANPYTASDTDPAKIADWAYQIADAMIKARSIT